MCVYLVVCGRFLLHNLKHRMRNPSAKHCGTAKTPATISFDRRGIDDKSLIKLPSRMDVRAHEINFVGQARENATIFERARKNQRIANEALTRKILRNETVRCVSLPAKTKISNRKNQIEKNAFFRFGFCCKTYATEAIFTIDDRQLTSVSNTNGYDTENVQSENAATLAVGSEARASTMPLCVNASRRTRFDVQVRESRRHTHSLVWRSVHAAAATKE